MRLNERTWTGHVINWIMQSIENGTTLFQYATNDQGIRMDEGRTLFPDVLLFIDRFAGIIFNGWELKFPDTAIDDLDMLQNALDKARQLNSNSFVTWNGSTAIIWLINDNNYNTDSLVRLKIYPNETGINTRNDLANFQNYQLHERRLRARLQDILHDLEHLYRDGTLHVAVNISSNIGNAISEIADQFIPLFRNILSDSINTDINFQNQFGNWMILERATLNILSKSSRRLERVDPIMVLAKFTYYKLIGKILFYKTLSENLIGRLPRLNILPNSPVKEQLELIFRDAQQIDYQAVFERDFTDSIEFNANIDELLFNLFNILSAFDFRYLPNEVIGNILENLVSKEEKQKFGQYFTSKKLASLVSMSAIKNRNAIVFDPTSGTGTFLSSFYEILRYRGITTHQQLLNQIWGNDISHFPAVLSVINLYKQNLIEPNNFPRVTRSDYFQLFPGQEVRYPDPVNEGVFRNIPLPQFDSIISNFPFIQQEDIDKNSLIEKFRMEFQLTQNAFVGPNGFNINERSDYFVYCFYNSIKFLRINGYLAAITSNAWLGKNYGIQLKQFLLDNFSIRYLFRSKAEHWFKDSQVSTVFITLQKTIDNLPTRFVTLNFRLEDYFTDENQDNHIEMMENLYNEIDHCDINANINWIRDNFFSNLYHKTDGTISVSIIQREYLNNQIIDQENWAINFLAQDPLQLFRANLVNPYPIFMDVGRGTRTGWDKMFILNQEQINQHHIEEDFLRPILTTSRNLSTIHHVTPIQDFLFVCDLPLNRLEEYFPYAFQWIQNWSNESNTTGIPLSRVFENRRPFWYSLNVEEPAEIFISINPNKKIFFTYCDEPITLNQRLIAIRVQRENLEILSAILNSIVSILFVEFNGVSRNLGVLDLNADFFKTKMRILNFTLLSNDAKDRIIRAFRPLSEREILDYSLEYQQRDRIIFDETILREFGYDVTLRNRLYEILIQMVTDRIEMRNR